MKKLAAILLCCAFVHGHAQAFEYEKRRVVYKNLLANLYVPLGVTKPPVVIAFGGSEGGMSGADPASEFLAPEGIAVLAIAFFKAGGLPPTLDQIPLEYFISAVDYAQLVPGLDPARIGVLSGSRGSEAALLLAAHDARIKAVAVAAPSSAAWYGRTTERSAWTLNGQDVPALRFADAAGKPQVERARMALADQEKYGQARIRVENIRGPILLMSAENDQVWPSSDMARDMVTQLKARNFSHEVKHDAYPTGHGFSREAGTLIKASVAAHFAKAFGVRRVSAEAPVVR